MHRTDLPVVSHSIRSFMLSSARFRCLFAGKGIQRVSSALLNIYSSGNSATRDGVEYAMRSFYRIHQDSSVHHTCLTIQEQPKGMPTGDETEEGNKRKQGER